MYEFIFIYDFVEKNYFNGRNKMILPVKKRSVSDSKYSTDSSLKINV